MTLQELLIEMQPFSDELKAWCKSHPEFAQGLKLDINKFITLQAVSTSHTTNVPDDEVIGFYVYAHYLKTPKFKQDFIINVGSRNEEFVLYAADTNGNETTYVKHIKAFFGKYGKNGHYNGTHWVEIAQLPKELIPRATDAIRLAGNIKRFGTNHITQDKIDEIYAQFQQLKK